MEKDRSTDEPKYLVIIPSFNAGSRLLSTVSSALKECDNVWVVDDGSDDDSLDVLRTFRSAHADKGLRVIPKAKNEGKGAAVYHGAVEAIKEGFTHAVTIDADGQHPTEFIKILIEQSRKKENSLILGDPIFGHDVPTERRHFRKLNNLLTDLYTLRAGLGDTLFGMRLYPLDSLISAFEQTKSGRGYDFDPEMAVRLVWNDVQPFRISMPVRYLDLTEGGVSHFRYLRDNRLLVRLHMTLMACSIRGGWARAFRNIRKWKTEK